MDTLDYQLKWAQHQCNLNSNIASLYRNSKYADVILLCEEQSIPCHKIVLSSTSMYFASIFEKLPQSPIMPIIYIVLPADLTYQAMKILIHYMYRGESRVSNDILKEVLHAGDVLKVRGLYRGDTGKENKSSMNISEKPHTTILRPSTSHHATPLNTTSNIQNTLQLNPDCETEKLVQVISPLTHGNAISTIPRSSIKGFDPIAFGSRKVYKVSSDSDTFDASALLKHGRVDNLATPKQLNSSIIEHGTGLVPKTPSTHMAKFVTTIKEEPVEWNEEFNSASNEPKGDRKQMYIKEEVTLPQTYQKLSCEICSEDFIYPADWVRHVEQHTEHTSTVPRKRKSSGLDINDENMASLRCDLCSKYFVTPADWVKHVQSRHTEMELAVENEKLSHVNTASTSSSDENTMRPSHFKRIPKPGR